jgi:hypothetical protein
MTQRLQIVVLLVLTVTIYVATAARPSLLDDADASHAMAAQAMLDRGDWAVLHMNGVAWLQKPPLHYWLVAASFALLGENAFATRLPVALAVTGRQEAFSRLPFDRTYLVAEKGGKALFVNRPLTSDQPSLETLVLRSEMVRPLPTGG